MKQMIGRLKNWDSDSYRASVQLTGSMGSYLDMINVARNIDDTDMVIGRSVLVAIPGGKPADAVVIAVFTV